MHLCVVQFIVSDTINHLGNSASTHDFIHTLPHTTHTLLELDSLIHCCHGNPIKGGHSDCNSGEICLSLFYLSLCLSFTHTYLFFHCQGLPFVSSITFLLSFSSSPCITLGTPLHLSLSNTMLPFHLLISRVPDECEYVVSLIKPSLC